jgi:pyruvate-ferredoxin/flavodoxin oxidoreductase
MLEQAQRALEERYSMYEDLAARDGSRFQPHWQDSSS